MPQFPIGGPDAALIELSAQHLTGESVEEVDEGTGEKVLFFHFCDDVNAAEIHHDFGSAEEVAGRLLAAADALRKHAERIRYRERQRTAGWT
jgi:hypothetical protein